MAKTRVAIINNAIFPEIYKPVEHWAGYLKGVAWKAFYAPHGELPDIDAFSHIILTGSEASILEREPWVERETEWILEAHAAGRVLLGSCYGHQLLAFALAGPARVGRCREPEIGWIPVERAMDSALLGSKGTAYTFSAHFDEVRNLPDAFAVLASSTICPIQAFGLKGRPVWGLQIHPEIDGAAARELLTAFRKIFPGFRPLYDRALASTPRDSRLILKIVKNFLAHSADKRNSPKNMA
jgi:GMP synthase-like glutamine amidotransferase